jgi:hypothetical protein
MLINILGIFSNFLNFFGSALGTSHGSFVILCKWYELSIWFPKSCQRLPQSYFCMKHMGEFMLVEGRHYRCSFRYYGACRLFTFTWSFSGAGNLDILSFLHVLGEF